MYRLAIYYVTACPALSSALVNNAPSSVNPQSATVWGVWCSCLVGDVFLISMFPKAWLICSLACQDRSQMDNLDFSRQSRTRSLASYMIAQQEIFRKSEKNSEDHEHTKMWL
jgi:hypothetical protein